jgi:hypothetical protein
MLSQTLRATVRAVAFILCFLVAGEPLLARPHIIAKLGDYPLLGYTPSRSQLMQRASQNSARLALAARKLGMSSEELRALEAWLPSARYVVLPRHLDAMAWHSGHTYVTDDVVIPAGTHGWEVDLQESGRTLRVLIPASCGNLSILREMMPRVAARHVIKSGVMAYSVSATTKRPNTIAAQGKPTAAIPRPGTPSMTPAPQASPVRTSEAVGIHPPAAARAHGFPWFVLGLIVPIFIHGGGGHQVVVPLAPTPKPTCPAPRT